MTRVQGQRKRPCRVCGRWYQPTSRQRERQRTCGDPTCVREWHRRNCRRWHRQNKQVTQATYLAERLVNAETAAHTKQPPRPPPRGVEQRWPRDILEQHWGIQSTVIVGYLARKVIREVRDAISR